MKKKFTVACFQTTSSNKPLDNINLLQKMFSSVKEKKIDLICTPECVAILSEKKKETEDYCFNWHGKFIKFISENAIKLKTYILVGSVPFKKKNGKFFNRSILINSEGNLINFYDKINLFDVVLSKKEKYLESKNYDAGKLLKVSNLPWGKLGMSICYDLRFPKLYKNLAKKGSDFFTIPAAFTVPTGKDHWKTLVRTRAIENGTFIFAPAQYGKHNNGRTTYGHSMIVDPWGKILQDGGEKICVIKETVDVREVENIRKKIPSMTTY